jgi:hypothetical protein
MRHEEWGDVNERAAACRRFIIRSGVAGGEEAKTLLYRISVLIVAC